MKVVLNVLDLDVFAMLDALEARIDDLERENEGLREENVNLFMRVGTLEQFARSVAGEMGRRGWTVPGCPDKFIG